MYLHTIASHPIGYTIPPVSESFERFAFGSYGLYNSRVKVIKINNDDLTKVELNTFAYPLSDGEGILSKYYRGRTLSLRIALKAESEDDLSTLIDEVKKNLRHTDARFSLIVTGERRSIGATLVSMTFNREYYHINWIQADLVLQVVDPYWRGDAISTFFETKTGQFYEEMTNLGSTESAPNIYIVTSSGSNTGLSFKMQDREITLLDSIGSGDIVNIDSQNKRVILNGNEIGYSGLFPMLGVGSNVLDIDLGGLTADITIVSPKNYL